jgi:hypothetical protein
MKCAHTGERRRATIGRYELSDKPTRGTAEFMLFRFAELANKNALHPFDWKRFYEFIIFAHSKRVGWDPYDVQDRVKQYGFDEAKSEMLAWAYWHCRCALHLRKSRSAVDSYKGWMRKGGTPWT